MATFGGSGFVGTAINVKDTVSGGVDVYTAPANTFAELNISVHNLTGSTQSNLRVDIRIASVDYVLYKGSLPANEAIRLPNVILGPGQAIRNSSSVAGGIIEVNVTGALFA